MFAVAYFIKRQSILFFSPLSFLLPPPLFLLTFLLSAPPPIGSLEAQQGSLGFKYWDGEENLNSCPVH